MRALPHLEFLNGIPVDREELDQQEVESDNGEEEKEEQPGYQYKAQTYLPEINEESGTDEEIERAVPTPGQFEENTDEEEQPDDDASSENIEKEMDPDVSHEVEALSQS